MQKNFGKSSKQNPRQKNGRRRLFWIMGTFVVLLILYWLGVDPIVSRFLLPHTGVYEGLDFYTSGQYLEFEHGDLFQDYIDSFHFDSTAKVVDFYYVDNKREDNPFYGKMSDAYALDVQLTERKYEEYKTTLCLLENYEGYAGEYLIYLCDIPENKHIQGVVALNDKARILRCVIITDRTGREDVLMSADYFLTRCTSLDFGEDDWDKQGTLILDGAPVLDTDVSIGPLCANIPVTVVLKHLGYSEEHRAAFTVTFTKGQQKLILGLRAGTLKQDTNPDNLLVKGSPYYYCWSDGHELFVDSLTLERAMRSIGQNIQIHVDHVNCMVTVTTNRTGDGSLS